MQTNTPIYNGNRILSFHPMDVPAVPLGDAEIPLTAVAITLRNNDQFVLIHNLKRSQWECPTGGIEPGETPEEAAIREIYEETSQHVTDLAFLGLIKFYIRSTDSTEFFAFYTATVTTLEPFQPNSETDQITLWRPEEPFEGPFGGLSQWMISQVTAR